MSKDYEYPAGVSGPCEAGRPRLIRDDAFTGSRALSLITDEMMDIEANVPDCFGALDKVFPMSEDGLRHSPPECLACRLKTSCLRTAIHCSSGVGIREDMVNRAYNAGAIGFFQRWSKRKYLDKIKKEGIPNESCKK